MHEPRRRSVLALAAVVAGAMAAIAALAAAPAAAAVQTIYDNALRNGWQDWGWATRNLAQTVIYQSAPDAISWEPDNFQGLYFHSNPGAARPNVADFTAVRFWINGNGGNQAVRLVDLPERRRDRQPGPDAAPRRLDPDDRDLGANWASTATSFDGIIFQANAAANQATAYVDDLELIQAATGPPPAAR